MAEIDRYGAQGVLFNPADFGVFVIVGHRFFCVLCERKIAVSRISTGRSYR